MLTAIALALVLHFIADFPLQPNDMAVRKSEEVGVLFWHASVHYWLFFGAFAALHGMLVAVLFATSVAACHAVIDWNVWRLFKRWCAKYHPDIKTAADCMSNESARHWFFVTVGADQLLHGLTIVGAAALYLP